MVDGDPLSIENVLSLSDIAEALGARPIPVRRAAAVAVSKLVSRLPFVPSTLEWLHAGRSSAVMDVGKANEKLQWQPKYSAAETLSALADAVD